MSEQRLHVPAADVELWQHLQDDVVVAQARRAVEGEVRPEAVRMREQGALRFPGRPGRVDEEERVVVACDVLDLAVRLEGGVGDQRNLHRCTCRACELLVLGRGEQQGGLRVVQLVPDLGRREPP
jgi:hypothetical protein